MVGRRNGCRRAEERQMPGPQQGGGERLRLALPLAFGLAFAAPAAPALAQTMTDVGTPRAETLIVEHLNGRIGNPTQMNFYQEGLQTGEGLRQLAYSQLWDIDTSTGKQFPALAATMPQPLNAEF